MQSKHVAISSVGKMVSLYYIGISTHPPKPKSTAISLMEEKMLVNGEIPKSFQGTEQVFYSLCRHDFTTESGEENDLKLKHHIKLVSLHNKQAKVSEFYVSTKEESK